MSARAIFKSWRPRIDNWVRYSPVSQAALALCYEARSALRSTQDPAWLSDACAAARCAPNTRWMQRIEARVQQRLNSLPREQLWRWQPPVADHVVVNKSAILKTSSPGEKGVVFVSFETQWEKLLTLGPQRLAAFAAEYDLVVAPTWSPPHSPTNFIFPRLFPGLLACTISNLVDLKIFPRLHTSYRPVQLFASSWVRPELYQPRPRQERDIDLLMVANFGHYKRHHVLFEALAKIPAARRPNVTLIGQPHGSRSAEVLLREMAEYGVSDCITLRSRIGDAEVVDALCRSRAALITSLREGSCVAVVEAMMANTPVALLRGAHIGSSAFLNEQTGRWLDGDRLHDQLPTFIAESDRCSPRAWLLTHGIHCHASTQTLNAHLRELAISAGQPWTRDIAAHHWRPDPTLLAPTDLTAAAAEHARIQQRFGLTCN